MTLQAPFVDFSFHLGTIHCKDSFAAFYFTYFWAPTEYV